MDIKPLLTLIISSGFFLLTSIFPHKVIFAESTTQEIINNLRITATVPETKPENLIDTDNDGLPNIWEIFYNLNPQNPLDASLDPDQDTLNNLQEYNYNTNPRMFDTNEGGIFDNIQIQAKTCPYKFSNDNKAIVIDNDGDSLPDWWEKLYSFDPYTINSNLDLDGDGLTNEGEYLYGTNPTVEDSDKDKLWDGAEVFISKTSPVNQDSDYDTLNDSDEFILYQTNPKISDTDNDNCTDGDEVLNGVDPLNKESTISLPDIKVIVENQEIESKNNQYKVLIANNFQIFTLQDTSYNTKLNFGNNIYNKDELVTTPNFDTYISSVISFYSPDNILIGQKYLNFNIQEPLTVFKHRQLINLFNIKIYLNDIFYNNLSHILGLNRIYTLKDTSIIISPQNTFKTDENGKVDIVLTKNEYTLFFSKNGFSPLNIVESGSIINPIIKLDKIYDLTFLTIIILITIISITIVKIKKRKHSSNESHTS